MARLKEKYDSEILPALVDRFGIPNVMAAPRLSKISINMGIGDAINNSKRVEVAQKELALIAGQLPVVTRAKKSISNFKLREGMAIGTRVTLRKQRMYEFLDRLISVALPRVRDFRGLPRKFDGRGNYTLGLEDQLIFPEINIDRIEQTQGMNISLTIRNSTDEMSLALLEGFGFPFRRN